jgi:HEPN domain-containing protein
MLKSDILKISRERLKDAEILFKSRRYEGAIYICGYALELRLKHQICKRLDWNEFPPNNTKDYKNFKTHNLDILLSLTGREKSIKNNFLAEWSITSKWNPQSRYQISSAKSSDASLMISSTKTLLKQL